MPLSNPYSVPSTVASNSAGTTVAASTTSVSLLASNAARKGATIWNTSTGNLYIDFGATVATTAYTAKINSGGYYEVPFQYNGAIAGVWDNTNGSAFIRELT